MQNNHLQYLDKTGNLLVRLIFLKEETVLKNAISIFITILFILSLVACTEEEKSTKNNNNKISTSKEVLDTIQVGMNYPNEYNEAKKKLNAPLEDNISIGNGNKGDVLKVKSGYVVVNIVADDDVHEVKNAEVAEVLTFKSLEKVKEYETEMLAKEQE